MRKRNNAKTEENERPTFGTALIGNGDQLRFLSIIPIRTSASNLVSLHCSAGTWAENGSKNLSEDASCNLVPIRRQESGLHTTRVPRDRDLSSSTGAWGSATSSTSRLTRLETRGVVYEPGFAHPSFRLRRQAVGKGGIVTPVIDRFRFVFPTGKYAG